MSSLWLAAGDTVGGAWGAYYGPRRIRRALDTWRTGQLALVLAGAVLAAVLSGYLCVAMIGLVPGVDYQAVAVAVAAAFGLAFVAGLRMTLDVLLRFWWRGRRDGQPVLVAAPTGLPATAYVRSRVGLLVPAVLALMFFVYGGGFAVLMAHYGSVWWSLPFVAWGLWGLGYLAPFVFGRVRSGGLYLTANGLEHRFGTVTAFVPWPAVRIPQVGDPLVLPAGRGSRRKSFPWNIAGDPTDAAPRRWVAAPLTYLPTTSAELVEQLTTYVFQPQLREYLGTPRSLEWVVPTSGS